MRSFFFIEWCQYSIFFRVFTRPKRYLARCLINDEKQAIIITILGLFNPIKQNILPGTALNAFCLNSSCMVNIVFEKTSASPCIGTYPSKHHLHFLIIVKLTFFALYGTKNEVMTINSLYSTILSTE